MDAVLNLGASHVNAVTPSLVDRVPVTIGKIDEITVSKSTGGAEPIADSVGDWQR
jgi:hypothetical protein